MFEDTTQAVSLLRRAVGSLEPHCLRGEDAARLLSLFAEAERLAGVGKALMARRIEETSLYRREGHRSTAEYVARRTGSSVGVAGRELETARQLEKLPAASEAWRAGKLSEAQAKEIASAAGADPSAEGELVAAAGTSTLPELVERCRRVRAAAAADEKARHHALHGSRYLRHWTGADGAFRMEVRLTPEAGAVVLAGLEPFKHQVFADARAAGRPRVERGLRRRRPGRDGEGVGLRHSRGRVHRGERAGRCGRPRARPRGGWGDVRDCPRGPSARRNGAGVARRRRGEAAPDPRGGCGVGRPPRGGR